MTRVFYQKKKQALLRIAIFNLHLSSVVLGFMLDRLVPGWKLVFYGNHGDLLEKCPLGGAVVTAELKAETTTLTGKRD